MLIQNDVVLYSASMEMVFVLLGINVDYPNDEGQTPLFTASYGGHEKVVDYLLSAGADANE